MEVISNPCTKVLNTFYRVKPKIEDMWKDYDFSEFIYEKSSIKGKVICNKHKDSPFYIRPNDLLNGHGCPKCKIDNQRKRDMLGYYNFVERANEVHNNKYDYPYFNYINNKEHIIAICPIHGEFLTRIDGHLNKEYGCPRCANDFKYGVNISFQKKSAIFYIVKVYDLYKIGVTTRSVQERFWGEGVPYQILKEISFKDGIEAINFEKYLKEKYIHLRYLGDKIFKYTGNCEVYTKNILEIEEIN